MNHLKLVLYIIVLVVSFLGLNISLLDGNKILIFIFIISFITSLFFLYKSNKKVFTGLVIFLVCYSFVYSYIGGMSKSEKLELSYIEEGKTITIEKNLEKCLSESDCNIVESYNKDLNQINEILENPNVFSIGLLKNIIKNIDSHKIILEQENIFYKNDIKINYSELDRKIYNSIYSRIADASYIKINLFYSEAQFKKYISAYLFEIDKQIKNNEEIIVNKQELNWKMLINREFIYEYLSPGINGDLQIYQEKVKEIKGLLK